MKEEEKDMCIDNGRKRNKKRAVCLVPLLLLALVLSLSGGLIGGLPEETKAAPGIQMRLFVDDVQVYAGTVVGAFSYYGDEYDRDDIAVRMELEQDVDLDDFPGGVHDLIIDGNVYEPEGDYHIKSLKLNLNGHSLAGVGTVQNENNSHDGGRNKVDFVVNGPGKFVANQIRLDDASTFTIQGGAEVDCISPGNSFGWKPLSMKPHNPTDEQTFEPGTLQIKDTSGLVLKRKKTDTAAFAELDCTELLVGERTYRSTASIELNDVPLLCNGRSRTGSGDFFPSAKATLRGSGTIHSTNNNIQFCNCKFFMSDRFSVNAQDTDIYFSKPGYPESKAELWGNSSMTMSSTSGSESELHIEDLHYDAAGASEFAVYMDAVFKLKNVKVIMDKNDSDLFEFWGFLSPYGTEGLCYTVTEGSAEYGPGEFRDFRYIYCINNILGNWYQNITINNGIVQRIEQNRTTEEFRRYYNFENNGNRIRGDIFPDNYEIGKAGYTDENGRVITEGEKFTVKADSKETAFKEWKVIKGGSTDILDDYKSATTTLTTPDQEVVLEATYVGGGSGSGSGGGSGGTKPVNPPTAVPTVAPLSTEAPAPTAAPGTPAPSQAPSVTAAPTPGTPVTTTNPDGSTTTTTTTTGEDGSKTVTAVTTGTDGTRTTEISKTDKDGSTEKTVEVVEKDGSSKRTTDIVKADGTTVHEEVNVTAAGKETSRLVQTDPSGSKRVTEQVKQPSGNYTKVTLKTTVKKDADGNITGATVTIETEQKTGKVTQKASYVLLDVGKPAKTVYARIAKCDCIPGDAAAGIPGEMIKAASSGKNVALTKASTTAKQGTITIPKTVKADGKTYTLTVLKKGFLKGNKTKPKKLVIRASALTKIEKGALNNLAKKATIRIKASKKEFKRIKKLIRKSGVGKSVKIKRG